MYKLKITIIAVDRGIITCTKRVASWWECDYRGYSEWA
jgi:hypothetical protein